MLGDCQSQLDTLEQCIEEHQKQCWENLNLMEDRVEDMRCNL